jgi:hypothetical protein
VHRLLRIFKKYMRVVRGLVEVQKAQRQTVLRGHRLGGQSMRRRQPQSAGFRGQEHRHPRHQQRTRQPLDDGVQQGPQIGLRTEAAAEFHQRLAVVVAMAVEGPVHPTLNPALQRVEDRGRGQNGRH